jgi:hypothetical protein
MDLQMKQHVTIPHELLHKIDECVALAKASTNNKLRANHFAAAQVYLQHYEAEAGAHRQTASTGRDDD